MQQALYEQAGGAGKIRAVLADFYDTVFADLMIGFLFKGIDKNRLIDREVELTLRALGADVPYRGRPLGEVHARHPIVGGHFMRRRKLLADAIARHDMPDGVRDAWLAHTDGLRAEITPDRGDECDAPRAARRARTVRGGL